MGSSVGYSCSGAERPDFQNASLNCSDGTGGGNGATLYCCVNALATSSGCSSDATITSCGGSSLGFSCTGTERPEQADASLVCSVGVAGSGGATRYCCASYTTSTGTCVQDLTVQGCGGSSIGFSCSGTDRPDKVNASLTCGSPTPGSGAMLYCCASASAPATAGCAADATIACAQPTTGYSCTGGATPAQTDATLTCGTSVAGAGGTMDYCCRAQSTQPAGCAADGAVNCATSGSGYTCTGGATPAQTNSALNCGTGAAAANGATSYCCSTAPAAPPCATDGTVTGCPAGASGYSCTTGSSPETATLLCDGGHAGASGKTNFCCTTN